MDDHGYEHIGSGGYGYYESQAGLIAVWGKEAIPFLDGMITNDMKTLPDGGQMLAAFPNAQGRLLAVVKVLRQGDRFLLETEEATREKLFQALHRFTFAGDFFVENLSDQHVYFEVFGAGESAPTAAAVFNTPSGPNGHFVVSGTAETFRSRLAADGAIAISDEVYETLRIENGIPRYGIDMDETTIVPELGLNGLISYTKGCYIGQEIIARIHFRGHVAKRLAGLVGSPDAGGLPAGLELSAKDGKSAGRITSAAYSPQLERWIALGYVRWDYLTVGTELISPAGPVTVKDPPFA